MSFVFGILLSISICITKNTAIVCFQCNDNLRNQVHFGKAEYEIIDHLMHTNMAFYNETKEIDLLSSHYCKGTRKDSYRTMARKKICEKDEICVKMEFDCCKRKRDFFFLAVWPVLKPSLSAD